MTNYAREIAHKLVQLDNIDKDIEAFKKVKAVVEDELNQLQKEWSICKK